MSAPKVRPLNPDFVALLDQLLADPMKAVCPICGETSFWDNRDSKPSETSPDFKCRNKSCVGATPMKRKSPYAVWIPDGYVSVATQPSKRLPAPPATNQRLPTVVPGGDEMWPDDPQDFPAALEGEVAEGGLPPYSWEAPYFALARRVAAFQSEIAKQYEAPFDLASINAMTFSIWNKR